MADAAASPVLWVSPDGRTAHILRPHSRPNRRSPQQFSIMGVRVAQYSDGSRAHSWCSNSQHECDPAVGEILGDSDRLQEPMAWGDSMPPCSEGATVIAQFGGAAALLAQLRQLRRSTFSADSDGVLIKQHSYDGGDFSVVRAGPDFHDYGVVDMTAMRCRTCCSNTKRCKHVAALAGTALTEESEEEPSADAHSDNAARGKAWERSYTPYFDLEKGCCRLICKSRLFIAENLQDALDDLATYAVVLASLNFSDGNIGTTQTRGQLDANMVV